MHIDQDDNDTLEQESENEFDAAFEEFSGGDKTSEPEDEPEPEPEPEPSVDEALSADDGDKDDAANDDETNDDEDEVDPGAALEAALAENNKLKHRVNSDSGRIAAFQKRVAQLEAPEPAKKAGEDDEGGEGEDPKLTQFREEYPEVAGPMDTLFKKQQDRIDELERKSGVTDDERAERALSAQEDHVAEKHSDWIAVVNTNEFAEWVSKQPKFIHDVAVRNGEMIVDGEEAVALIDLYKAHGANVEPDLDESQDEDEPNPANKNLADKRARQLKSAAAVPTGGAGSASGPADDFEKAFDYYAGKQK